MHLEVFKYFWVLGNPSAFGSEMHSKWGGHFNSHSNMWWKITLPCRDLNPGLPRSPVHEADDLQMCHRASMIPRNLVFNYFFPIGIVVKWDKAEMFWLWLWIRILIVLILWSCWKNIWNVNSVAVHIIAEIYSSL